MWGLFVHFPTICHIERHVATVAKLLVVQGFYLFSISCETYLRDFQDRRLQPLGHSSNRIPAARLLKPLFALPAGAVILDGMERPRKESVIADLIDAKFVRLMDTQDHYFRFAAPDDQLRRSTRRTRGPPVSSQKQNATRMSLTLSEEYCG